MRDSSSLVDMKSGVCAGISQVLVGHPFDTLKVRLQTDGHSTTPLKYLRVMLRTEGPLSLYKGLTPPLVGAGFWYVLYHRFHNKIFINHFQAR